MKISAEEELLLAACVKKDPEALKLLASKLGPPVYGFLAGLMPVDEPYFEIVMSDAFQEALVRVQPFEEKVSFLATVLYFLMRQIKKDHPQLSSAESPLGNFEPRLSLMIKSLWSLPLESRALILMRDQLALTLDEISVVLGCPKEGLKNRLHDARLQFRNAVGHNLTSKKTGHAL